MVSQEFQCRSISFFCGPNHASGGASTPGACARIVPRPVAGKAYSGCSSANSGVLRQ